MGTKPGEGWIVALVVSVVETVEVTVVLVVSVSVKFVYIHISVLVSQSAAACYKSFHTMFYAFTI